jgi:uncharacterized protein (UPF0261 family)
VRSDPYAESIPNQGYHCSASEQWIPNAPNALLDERIKQHGYRTLLIDTGVVGEPRLKPDISRNKVADAEGADIAALVASHDRGEAVPRMSRGAPVLLSRLVAEGRTDGVFAFGWKRLQAIAKACCLKNI